MARGPEKAPRMALENVKSSQGHKLWTLLLLLVFHHITENLFFPCFIIEIKTYCKLTENVCFLIK